MQNYNIEYAYPMKLGIVELALTTEKNGHTIFKP